MKSTPLKTRAPFFEETSSLVGRLKTIIIAVITLIFFGFAGIYFSSQPFLEGLQDMKSANIIMNSITIALDALDSSNKEIDTLAEGKDLGDASFIFEESQRLFKLNLKGATRSAASFPAIQDQLLKAKAINEEYELTVKKILESDSMTRHRRLANVLVANEFFRDVQEALRKSQIMMKNQSDLTFSTIYQGRLKPLIAGVVLSSIFMTFVITFGFSITNRLRKSLQVLLSATEEVSLGNFEHRAEILQQDEMGKVTYAFNGMLDALHEMREKNQISKDRISVLQGITAAFSEALTPEEIFNIIVNQGFKAFNADAGAIGILSKDGELIEYPRLVGYGKRITSLPMTAVTPSTDTIRFLRPIFIENKDQLYNLYPEVDRILSQNAVANAALPLAVGAEVIGVLVFTYSHEKVFSAEEKEFMVAFARQSAQALHRAQLFENTKLAIQARDEFLSIASHELKTPLTPLKLQLQGLSRQIKKDETSELSNNKILKIVESSDKQITRLARLIENLLDVSRITAGKLTLNKENIVLSQVIDEVVRIYGDQLKDVLGEVKVHADKSIQVHADKVRLEQVIINLLTNAAKYAPGKPVYIDLIQDGHQAKLKIRDEGPGISPENQSRVFDRFERVQVKENIGGLGLGLYISKQIIEAHGGKIFVESIVGEGATFTVEIPIFEEKLMGA